MCVSFFFIYFLGFRVQTNFPDPNDVVNSLILYRLIIYTKPLLALVGSLLRWTHIYRHFVVGLGEGCSPVDIMQYRLRGRTGCYTAANEIVVNNAIDSRLIQGKKKHHGCFKNKTTLQIKQIYHICWYDWFHKNWRPRDRGGSRFLYIDAHQSGVV